jgi:hypothetical protein
MKMRMVVVLACLGFLIMISSAHGQQPFNAGRSEFPFSRDPCLLGPAVGVPDGINAYAIHDLIQISELIIKGTVARVLPSEVLSQNPRNVMHTTSLISIDEVLRGTPPPSNTIAITQLGGQVGPCSLTVKDAPVVDLREEYILFLVHDLSPSIPNNSGSPRYTVYGVYSGKAKIVDGKIQFSPGASYALREYNGTDLAMFKDIVKRGVDVRKLRPVDHLPGTPVPPPGKRP